MLERRRAVALARHYREFEGLSIRQIADRLGRSPATIKAYFYDPRGEKARAVKARYVGVCRGCGAYTQPRNGKGDAYAYCKAASPARSNASGPGSACSKRCATGRLASGDCRRRTTGRAPMCASALAQYAPAPTHLIWWLLAAAFIIGIVAVLGMPEPGTVRPGVLSSLRPHVTVPHAARRAFVAALPALAEARALAGFYLALGPSWPRSCCTRRTAGGRRPDLPAHRARGSRLRRGSQEKAGGA